MGARWPATVAKAATAVHGGEVNDGQRQPNASHLCHIRQTHVDAWILVVTTVTSVMCSNYSVFVHG